MKLSNKLLIGLSLLVYIVPLSAYISTRSGGIDSKEFYEKVNQESRSFNTPSKLLRPEKVKPFENIQLIGDERIKLYLVKDDVYGIKLVDNKKNTTKVSYGANEELIIHVNSASYLANQIFIYAPSFHEITLNGISLDNFVVDQDSISLNVIRGTNSFALGNERLKFVKANFTKSKVNLKLGKGLQHLDLRLKDAAVVSNISNLNHFLLTTANSSYSMGKPEKEKAPSSINPLLIKYFSIHTEGSSNIWFPEKVNIENIEGSLSDSTFIHLPITSLRKLIK